MSSVKNSPLDAGGQPDPLSQAKTADDYWAQAEEILKRLRGILAERPAIDVPGQDIATVRWWMDIVYLGMEFNWVMDRFQQDPNVDPALRAMLRSVLKLNSEDGGRVEDPLPGETPPADDKMRNSRVEADTESDEATSKDLEMTRQQRAARAAIYLWFLSRIRESDVIKREQGVGAGCVAGTDRVLRSHSKKK
ncbi:hypothetical protein FOPG_13421 [Fusarium oxysporum f. sp. conglutinans race 2 54008]|uniref:Uncharacterized protein n=3 Tax=Fusarium oxysporum f. sp. conglutinans TaxID=100902 RepID=A0A8H6G7P1_FUSOX|nr:hypothetical protein FOXB_04351 [Fusarium oxysporum f. sp. conglutinans Fo5176]EXL70801.1 hypothetical protein FOPG_13421 [Fusarium oxysporum f. sp. conglutinans race 2 54008]KAF6512908.1 hypothetical protein HZS61_007714 [Fusarium oxysporum f. sp. conglutinans]KAG7003695.1 hypothetical protein FocnCong_v000898 [Fusarium oxysporum f. sp. conglutinans]KAI8395727.1 hypothetical protein FOFC_21257 [Fusarium oxysporum]